VAPSPVAGLGLPYPAALSFPWPSLTALTLSERERERKLQRVQQGSSVSVCMSTMLQSFQKKKNKKADNRHGSLPPPWFNSSLNG